MDMDINSSVAGLSKSFLSGTRSQWGVGCAFAVLLSIVWVTLVNLWSGADVESPPATHRLSLSFTVINPLPRDLDNGLLSIKLPSQFSAALVTNNPAWRVMQQGADEQILLFTPKRVNAFASEDVELEVFLSPRLSAPSEKIAKPPVPSMMAESILHQPRFVPDAILPLLQESHSLDELDRVLRKEKLGTISLPGELNRLSAQQRSQYIYLLAMMSKAVELKQSANLSSGWAFDAQGVGEYILCLSVVDNGKPEYWSISPLGSNYQSAGLVDETRFYDDPNSVFSPFSGAGLEVKFFNKILLEKLPEK